MLLHTSQDQVRFHRHFDNIRFHELYTVNQAIRILGRGLLPDTALFAMTKSDLVQELLVSTNSFSLYKLQLRDTRLALIQLDC